MIVVVADTSPLNYLIQLDHVELLRRLYSRVLIPEAVLSELQREPAPCRSNYGLQDFLSG
jgi:predicted nucleic acid-binding protein